MERRLGPDIRIGERSFRSVGGWAVLASDGWALDFPPIWNKIIWCKSDSSQRRTGGSRSESTKIHKDG
jgi:hypothetical protein